MSTELSMLEYLAKLEAEYAMLGQTIERIRKDLGVTSAPEVNTPLPGGGAAAPIVSGMVRSDEFFQMSMPEAIKRYLAIMKQPQTPKTIEVALRDGGFITTATKIYAKVSTAIRRLSASGDIVNVGKGWGLADWYRGRSFSGPTTPAKKRRRSSPRKKTGKRSAGPKPSTETKETPSPPAAPDGMKWREFLKQRMKAGKSMKEASAEWKQLGQTSDVR
jgi:hypothetical protein